MSSSVRVPMRCRPPILLFAAAALLAAGCGEAALPTGARRTALINGEETAEYPAVALLQRPGGPICTATLVGRRTVVTAAHCVPAGEMPQLLADGESWPIASITPNPSFRMGGYFYDLAVIGLAAAPSVQPIPLATEPPAAGQQVVLVGYGSSHDGATGIKRAGSNTVAEVTNMLLVIKGSANGAANTCLGDSGGPVLALQQGHLVQVGVHSSLTGDCGDQSQATRLDPLRGWATTVADGDLVAVGAAPAPRLAPATAAVVPWMHRAPVGEPPAPPATPDEPDRASGCDLAPGPAALPPLLVIWLLARTRRWRTRAR